MKVKIFRRSVKQLYKYKKISKITQKDDFQSFFKSKVENMPVLKASGPLKMSRCFVKFIQPIANLRGWNAAIKSFSMLDINKKAKNLLQQRF